MTARTVRISIGEVREVGKGWRLQWTLLNPDGSKRGKTITHADKDILDIFRARMLEARAAEMPFDQTTGLPPGVERPGGRRTGRNTDPAGYDPTRPLLVDIGTRTQARWDKPSRRGTVSGSTTKDRLDGAVDNAMALLRADAPELTAEQRKAARAYLRDRFTPAEVRHRRAEQEAAGRTTRRAAVVTPTAQQRYQWRRADAERAERQQTVEARNRQWEAFFERYGLRWWEVDVAAVERALEALSLSVDGDDVEQITLTGRFVLLNELFEWGVKNRRLAANPVHGMDRDDRPSTTVAVTPLDLRRVLPLELLLRLLATVRALGEQGNDLALRLVAYFALLGLAGLRPAEARAVRVSWLYLPEQGWGSLILGGRLAAPGRRFTPDGARDEDGALKWQPLGVTRPVPLPPRLVALLHRHIEMLGLSGDDRLFVGADGKPINADKISSVWRAAKGIALAGQDDFAALVPYGLRHTRATYLLASGLDEAQVARWLGHSTWVLNNIYRGVRDLRGIGYAEELKAHVDDIVPPEWRSGAGPQPVDIGTAAIAARMVALFGAAGADVGAGLPLLAAPNDGPGLLQLLLQHLGGYGPHVPREVLGVGRPAGSHGSFGIEPLQLPAG
ncbi:tyrosine-type recombinase/integrase [Geodermatophilus sp. URMC 61]|uniref:tyrosine-type recombinase/integrase n=1 Tax=Geodermatophilus sp. URMC 61 TaxID=3423411 RepID=UPI00406D3AD2